MSLQSRNISLVNQTTSPDVSPKRRSIMNPEQIKALRQKEKIEETKQLLKELKSRNCKGHIKQYQEELNKLRYIQNPYNVTSSYSSIERKLKAMGDGKGEKDTHNQFKKLREYFRLYKERLYLVPRHLILEEDLDSKGLDYHTYKDLKARNCNLLDIVREHEKDQCSLLDSFGMTGKLKSGDTGYFKK